MPKHVTLGVVSVRLRQIPGPPAVGTTSASKALTLRPKSFLVGPAFLGESGGDRIGPQAGTSRAAQHRHLTKPSWIVGVATYLAAEDPIDGDGVDQHNGENDEASPIEHERSDCGGAAASWIVTEKGIM